jgi:hypothetical protein
MQPQHKPSNMNPYGNSGWGNTNTNNNYTKGWGSGWGYIQLN